MSELGLSMVWAVMTIDYYIKPTEAEVDYSIKRMLNLFDQEGYPSVRIQQLDDDTINVGCDAYIKYPIEKLASSIGGDEWGWIPIPHKIADGNWRNLENYFKKTL